MGKSSGERYRLFLAFCPIDDISNLSMKACIDIKQCACSRTWSHNMPDGTLPDCP